MALEWTQGLRNPAVQVIVPHSRECLELQRADPAPQEFLFCYICSCAPSSGEMQIPAGRVPGCGFPSSVAPESDSRSLICLPHMKVLEHL